MLQAPEGMHRIGLCLDSLVHYLITGPPPIGGSFTDEVNNDMQTRAKLMVANSAKAIEGHCRTRSSRMQHNPACLHTPPVWHIQAKDVKRTLLFSNYLAGHLCLASAG